MKFLTGLIILSLLMLATGCNVEEKSGGDLIAGHVPVQNAFTITLPSNRSYKAGQTLDFFLTFPYAVTVVGTPRLALVIGSTTRYANYLLGNGTTELAFRYTIQPGENDTNGIAINSNIDLNGGALTFVGTSGLDDCNLAVTIPSTSGIKVDTTDPTITGVSGPSSRTYYKNQALTFIIAASEAVFVTGTPRIALTIGSTTRYATYSSGSGTSALNFQYIVADGDMDNNGITTTSPLQLNGGLIKDAAGNPLSLTFTPPNTTNVNADGNTPYVTSVTPPANGTYTYGQSLNFTLTFSEPVIVTGSPWIEVIVGTTSRSATYSSGSGTSALVFTYVVQGSDVDTNGITFGAVIDVTAATIQDSVSTSALTSFIPPSTPNVKVSAPAPYISSFNWTNKTYIIGETINITAIFNQAVTITGSPRIAIDVGGTIRYATYSSGSGTTNIMFTSPIVTGDNDSNGVTITSPLDMNGGSIQNLATVSAASAFTQPVTPNLKVDAVAPTITSITYPADQNYTTGNYLQYTVNFSETVYITSSTLVKLDLTVGGNARQASYISGSGTSSLIFRYTVIAADADSDGVDLAGPINVSGAGRIADVSGAGNGNTAIYTFTPTVTPNVRVNTGYPQVLSIDSPANGWYKLSQNMDFTLHFTEAVNVSGSPEIALTVGATSRAAVYQSGHGTDTLVFRYTVPSGDLDSDGVVAATSISLPGGATIKDLSNTTNSGTTLPSQTLTGVLVDGVVPTITNMSAPANNTYAGGEFVDFTATFSESVTVIGSPRIALDVGGITRYATYNSGSPGTSIVFRYTVQNGHVDLDGIGNTSPLELNGGSIRDSATNDSNLTFTPPNTSGVMVNGATPTIVSVTPPADGNYVQGQQWDFTVATSDAATVSGTPRIPITVGATTRYANYASGSGSTTLIFSYTTQYGDDDSDGIALTGAIDINGGSMQYLGVDFSLTFTNPNTSLVKVDTTVPTITSVTAPANSTYAAGQNLDFTVNFSEAVTVSGTPRLQLTIGATTRYANYTSGSGTSSWIFRHTVVSGDEDTDGIAVSSPLDLNGGTIKDSFLNNLSPLTFTPPNTSLVLVDALAPSISSVTPPANGSYKAGQNLDFTVNFTETVVVTGANPTLSLDIGGSALNATYVSGSNSSSLLFRYTVQSGDTDSDGISSSSPVSVTGGAIKDVNNNNAILTFTPPNTTAVLVDTTLPSISSVVAPANSTYLTGNNLDFTVTFSESVNVTGTPRLVLTIGSTTRYANYLSGSGTTSWTFRYTVLSGDYDNDGIAVASPLDLNGGSIADSALNGSGLTFTPPNTTGVLVDAVLPIISSITAPGNGAYKNGSSMSFTLNTNKTITVNTTGGTPRMTLTVGSTTVYANYASGSGTQSLIFTYNPGITHLDLDGVAVSGASLSLNGGTMKDALNNNLDLTYPSIPSLAKVFVVYPAFEHWYDLDDSSRVSYTNDGTGDAINSITDIMGGSNLSATGTARPYYFGSGFGSANRGYMKYDGSNDIMSFAGSPNFKSVIFVFRSQSTTSTTNLLIEQTTGPAVQKKKVEPASGNSLALNVSGEFSVNGAAFSSSNTSHTWAWAANTNYVLSVRWSSSSARTTKLGSTTFNGRIAAVIVLDDTTTALTDSEYTALYNFLSSRYGVP